MTQPELHLHLPEPHDTAAVAAIVAGFCRAEDLITLDGPLGAGKTQFVRALTQGLGGDPADVSSPTFTLIQEYALDCKDRDEASTSLEMLVHIDAYRLSGGEELETIGWIGDGQDFAAPLWWLWSGRHESARISARTA